jgi:hypothetical protein
MLSYGRVFDYSCAMKNERSALSNWTPEHTFPQRAPKPFSGLVEQQRWFMKSRPLAEQKGKPEILNHLERRREEFEQ